MNILFPATIAPEVINITSTPFFLRLHTEPTKFNKTFLLMEEPPLERAFEPILITTLFILFKYSSLISLIVISIDIKNIEV